MKQKYWYPTAYSCWDSKEALAIERVLDSGQLTMGPEVAAFEREFADFHGRKHGVMVNSGSSANLLMVEALQLERGRREALAMVPALAWSTTYAPLIQNGYSLRLQDCGDDWNARHMVTDQIVDCDIVMACSILGNPADLQHASAVAKTVGAFLLDDNCESLGALTPEGKLCGTYGLMSSFSFFYSHQISGIEGGMVLTDEDELAKTLRMLRAHGWSRDVEEAPDFDHEYDFRLFGYNVRPLEINAAVAREQLKKLPGFIGRRSRNVFKFWEEARGANLPIKAPHFHGRPSPFGIHFMVDVSKDVAANKEARLQLAMALRAANIDCRPPTGGSFTRHFYGRPWADQKTPNADRIHDTGLFLGNGPVDLTNEIGRAIEVMKKVLVA